MKRILVATAVLLAAVSARAGDVDVTSYIHNGLVSCWDGIENAGAGVHDPAVTTWTDHVSGRAFDLTGVTVNSDGMAFAGNSDTSYGQLSAADTDATFEKANNGTLELLLKQDAKASAVALQSSSASGLAFGPNGDYVILSVNTSPYLSGFDCSTAINLMSVHYAKGFATAIWTNAVSAALSGSKNNWGSADDKTWIGRRANGLNNPFAGSIHAIRLYSRNLTADEIAWNNACDQVRFKGADAATAFAVVPRARVNGSGVIERLVTFTNETGEAVLSADGGATRSASTNVWVASGTSLTLTVHPSAGKRVIWGVLPANAAVTNGTSATIPFAQDATTVAVRLESTGAAGWADGAYVTNGLVACWDVASSPRGDGGKRWYSLANDASWQLGGSCGFSNTTGALEFPSGSSCSFGGTMPTFLACETCVRWDKGERFFSLLNSYGGFCFNVMGAICCPSQYHTQGSRVRVAKAGVPETYAILYSSVNTPADRGYYRGGLVQGVNTGAFASYGNQNQVSCALGGNYNGSSPAFTGGLYALRLYSRNLSGDELKRNAALDGLRFLGRALPDGWREQGGRLQARLSFDLASGVTVSTGGTALATSAPVWLDAGTEVTAAVTPGSGEYAVWNGAPLEAVLAADGNSVVFTLHAPRTLECELLTPDLVWQGTVTKVNYSNEAATVYLPDGTVSGTAVFAKRLVLGGRGTAATLTLTKGVDLKDRLDVNRNATLSICTASGATNGVTVRAGGKITHAQNGSSDVNRIDLTTDGPVAVEEYGLVSADGRGLTSAGTIDSARRTVADPTGSGRGSASNHYGGGAVHLAMTGALTVDGEVTARGANGSTTSASGGSVWVTAGSLSGSGTICSDGGSITHWAASTGGPLACFLKNPGAKFSSFAGEIASNGGVNYQKPAECGADGTVYLRTADDYGHLIIAANNTSGKRTVAYPASQTLLDVERITVTNDATLSVTVASRIRLHGDLIAYNGTFTSAPPACVELVDFTRVSHLAGGKQTYPQLVCQEPGKKILFAAGSPAPLYQVAEGGAFTITGVRTDPVWLLPSPGDGSWSLKLLPDVARDVKYAAVSNSLALSGLSIIDQGGTNLGGNDGGWSFTDIIEPGAAMRWTGATDTDWKNAGNWSPAREPVATDYVTIYARTEGDAPVAHFPVIDGAVGTPAIARLTVDADATLTVNGGGLLVTDRLIVLSGGFLDVRGSEVITLNGNLSLAASSGFACGKGRVILTGNAAQRIDAAGATFNRLYVRKDGGSVAWYDGLTADYFECTTTNALAFTFESGRTFALSQLFLCGQVGDAAKLSLSASQTGTRWLLKATTAQRVAGVTVADSDATGGTTVYASAPSGGNGNTPGWDFGNVCSEWTGKAGDGKFATAGNWSDGVVPGPTSRVAIACAEGSSLTITMPTSDLTLSNLVVGIGGGTVNMTVNGGLDVAENIDFREMAKVTFNTKKPCTAGRDVAFRSGAFVTHTANGTAENYAVNVAAGGDCTVESGAKISADGKGYAQDKTKGTEHGGSDRYNHACYGSVFSPVLSGRGSNADTDYNGGGVIGLTAGGLFTNDGEITARGSPYASGGSYSSGAGGSVWVTCATLAGSGLFDATAGRTVHDGSAGGGGRVSVNLTGSAATFADWHGTALALYGWHDNNNHAYSWGGAGTVWLGDATGAGTLTIGGAPPAGAGTSINTWYTQLPMADDGTPNRAYRKADVVLVQHGRLYLTNDVTVADLDLREAVGNKQAHMNTNVCLNGHTLTIRSRVHKDGRGWYKGWEKWVDKGVNPKTGQSGKIVWMAGLAVIVR